VLSNAEKRAVRLGEKEIVPRVSDLHALFASTSGKIELEYSGEDKREDDLIDRLVNRAVLKVFDRYFQLDALKTTIAYFAEGGGVKVSDSMASASYLEDQQKIPGLKEGIAALGVGNKPPHIAAGCEFILEGLHLHQKLNKEREGGRYTYRS
jgi:magnesium chelatase subunit I